MTTSNNHERREARAKQTAEVFTPPKLVSQMLAKLPKEVWKKDKTFCDPACGNGNMLLVVLDKKLNRGHKPLVALNTIYGVDIMQDNVRECRYRLLKLVSLWEEITEEHIKIVFDNIKWICIKRCPEGSLGYDFGFRKSQYNADDIQRWYKQIHRDNILDEVELPVMEETTGLKGTSLIDFGPKRNLK